MRDKNFNVNGFNKIKNTIKEDELFLAQEPFYTIQGEGLYAGVPAFFVRTSHCALRCYFCSTGNTTISTTYGNVRIKNISEGYEVLSYNFKEGKEELDIVESVSSRLVPSEDVVNASFYERSALSGSAKWNLYVTKEHRFWDKEANDWIEAQDSNERIIQAVDGKNFLVRIHPLTESEISLLSEKAAQDEIRVYSLTTEKHHNYFTNKLLSHNCDRK